MAFNRRVDVWGEGGLFEEAFNRKFNPEQPQQRPDSIIGGQWVAGDDIEGRNAATADFNEREEGLRAYQKMRERNPLGVRRGKPGSLGNPQNNLGQDASAPLPPLQSAGTDADVAADTGPLPNPNGVANVMSTYEDMTGQGKLGVPYQSLANPTPSPRQRSGRGIYGQGMRGNPSFFSSGDSGGSNSREYRTRSMVEKQRSMKQPGYQSGGKVKMPERPRTDVQMERDRQMAEQEMDMGMRKGAAQRANPKYPDDAQAMEQKKKLKPGMAGYKSGGAVCKRKGGMRGYATGGQIGDEMQDDGKDTIEIGVREGEYLVTPEGTEVIGSMVGGEAEDPYTNGVAFLDQANRVGTGEEPGPVPINEAGEEVQQGMRNGGGVKMGYNQGGFVDDYGNFIDPRKWGASQQQYAATPQGAAALVGNTRGTTQAVTQSQAQMAQQPPLDMSRTARWTRAGERAGTKFAPVYKATKTGLATARGELGGGGVVAPAVMGGITVADNMTGAKDAYYNDPNVDAWEKAKLAAGELSSFALPAAGTVVGSTMGSVVGTPVVGGVAGGVGGFTAGAIADRGLRTLLGAPAEGTEAFNEYAANWTPEQVAEAEAAGLPPEQYFRSFGGGEVDLGAAQAQGLRSASEAVAPGGMNIVQNTGGPNGEVIVREDINGVPTFTNLRQEGFDGSARTLQAEADARAAQDVGIRAMQEQVVQQMRDSAPIYDQEGVDQRRSENLAMQQAAMRAGGRGSAAKPVNLRKELEERNTIPTFDADGNETGRTPDIAKVDLIESVISQLNPAIEKEWGAPFHELPDEVRLQVYNEIQPVINDTQAAIRAQKNQGYPTSALPRTGANTLRALENSDISFWGDAVFGDATFGEYGAGVWDGQGTVNDTMVGDPLSMNEQGQYQTRIPLQRLMRGQKDEQEALRRYGYTDPNR